MHPDLSNRLLRSLSPDTRHFLERKLEAVALPVGTVLFKAEHKPTYAYFITSGIASVVADLKGGRVVEVVLSGSEGVPGSLHLLAARAGSTRCSMQVDGTGLRIDFGQLYGLFLSNFELHARILQHVQYEALIVAQMSACNRLHESTERVARWLLMAADRLGLDELFLTQEALGNMLATRRSTVTTSAGLLQKAGMIEYSRGRVRILNRKDLESVACECYPIVRRLQQNLYADAITVQQES